MKLKKVRVLMENRRTQIALSDKVFDRLTPFFRFRPSGYEYNPDYKLYQKYLKDKEDDPDVEPYGWDGYTNLLHRDGKVPTGLFRALREEIETKAKIKFKVEDMLRPITFQVGKALKSDRDFQNNCAKAMMLASGEGGGLIINATGTGKTYIAGLYFSYLDGEAVFIVDELTLLKQARNELSKVLGEKVGMVGKSKFKPRRITVATIQTLDKHRHKREFRKWFRHLDVAIIDEIHLQINKRAFRAVEAMLPACVFGLTATLQMRKQGVRFRAWALCGPVIFNYPLKQGVEDGFLTKGKVYLVKVTNPQFGRIRRGFIAYGRDYDKFIVNGKKRNEVTEKLVRRLHKKKKYIVLVVERLKHLYELSKSLEDIKHKIVCGAIDANSRFRFKQKFDEGNFRLLIVNKVFTKGIDIKRVDAIVDAAGSGNENRAGQVYGRGVRLHKDKDGLELYDISDVGNRFEKAAKRRKRAYKALGVKVKTYKG